MSSVDVAVSAFKEMEPEDLRALSVIEVNMSRYRFVPEEMLRGPSELPTKEVTYRLRRLDRLGLIIRSTGSYVGYALNRAGYDCLEVSPFGSYQLQAV